MIAAIAIWNECVSNVFDFADGVLLVEFDGAKEVSRTKIDFDSSSFSRRISRLNSLNVKILICGAISRSLAKMVTDSGIELLPYVTGDVNEVLKAYSRGQLTEPQFSMPGCWFKTTNGKGRCGQIRRRCRQRGNRKNLD